MELLLILASIIAYVSLVNGDLYMSIPKGGNNRLNEKSANRRNGNRVFDSQNNNRGGYNCGDLTKTAAGNDFRKQYQTEYVMSPASGKGESVMPIEWTNQHGCGGNKDDDQNKLNCNLVIQIMCQKHIPHTEAKPKVDEMRDGTNTNTNQYKRPPTNNRETYAQFLQRKNQNALKDRALQEPYEWYDKCHQRKRNQGLFTADQKLKGVTSKYTRQNANGNRRGYECPEERDYYPYWHPTPWKDLAVLAERADRCSFYQTESFNVQPKYECVEKWKGEVEGQGVPPRHYSEHNNQKRCEEHGGNWTMFHNYLEILDDAEQGCAAKNSTEGSLKGRLIWGRPLFSRHKKCLVKLDPPMCKESPFSRVNHLGNGLDLEPNSITWKIPAFTTGTHKCVLRMRYNISTDDYHPQKTDSEYNGKEKSPVTNDPVVNVGAYGQGLRLAINTAQFGRTFQDRTHILRFINKDSIFTVDDQVLYVVQVRGKRGNIAQTFPAVEYDFMPTNLRMREKDMVMFTWTGSNTHNNGNPAGDGQSGNAGQGTQGTDRSNVCGLGDRSSNFILPAEHPDNICKNIKTIVWSAHGVDGTSYPIDATNATNEHERLDACIQLMSGGFYKCFKDHKIQCKGHSLDSKQEVMNDLLNNVPATFQGIILQFRKGRYNYVCSRNNAFTNRSHKASIIVTD